MSKIILKGKKVILRPLSLKDAPRFCQWLSDQEVTKFMAIYDQPPPTLKEEREYIKKHQKATDSIHLSIETTEGNLIGTASLMKIDKINRRSEFGIFIGDKKYWGQGCGTEACRLIVDYGFRKLKLNRIYLSLIAYNIRGQKSYQKVGFKIEGRARDHHFRSGYFHDQIQMGLLCDEYLKNNTPRLRSGFKKKYGKRFRKH